MAITRLRADQQVSQSSITENELSSSLVGNGLTGGEGTALSVSSSHESIKVASSGIRAHGGVISGSAGIANLGADIVSGSSQVTLEKLTSGSSATTHISEGTNLYYTDARVKTKLTAEDVVSGSSQVTLEKLTSGSGATTHITEGTNLYYTDARVKTKLTAENVVTESAQVIEFLDAADVVSSSAQIEGATINRLLNNITASGNISASGYLSASAFYGSFVEISSSVVFTSGSSIFGDDTSDTHEFTGSTTFGGDLTANGTDINLNGNVNLGDATADDIDINGRLVSHLDPKTTNTYDLGSTGRNWRNLHVSGTAYIDTLNAAGFTIGGSGGGSNSGTFSNVSASKAEFVNLYASGGLVDGINIGSKSKHTGSFSIVDIDGGAIDGVTIGGATIATSNITVGSGKTLNVSAGTLTLAADQISGDAINGGTIGSVTISQLSGNLDANNVAITNANIDSGTITGTTITGSNITVGSGKTLNVSAGTLTLADDQISGNKVEGGTISSITISSLGGALNANNKAITNVDINSGKIDGTIIGRTSATEGTFTNLTASVFESTANVGTAPLVVESTTLVTNLNADKLDSQQGTYYLDATNFVWEANDVPTSAIDGTLSQWTASSHSGIHRYGKVVVSGSSTKHVTFTEGNISASGKVYKETLMNSFTFGATASFKQINSSKFEWKTSEHIRLGSEMIFVNGMLQDSGSSNDYTILNSGSLTADGAVISFNYKVPSAHSKVKLMYVPK